MTSKFPSRRLVLASLAFSLAPTVSLGAQTMPRFDRGIVVSGAWLQANALPLDRDAMPSNAFAVGIRRPAWSAEVGWLRIARALSTVQGGYASLGRVMRWQSLEVIPSVQLLGGQAYVSYDSTGFDWTDASGNTGHTARFSYSEGATFGGGVGLTAEIPIYSMLAARGVVSQWFFSGEPVAKDRSRTVLGLGLSVRVGR